MRVRGVVWGCAVCVMAAGAGRAQSFSVTSYTLANGMKVLVEEDHHIPNVALQFFFRVGSRNEHPGVTGISHFFEHMMFNGSGRYGPKQFDNIMVRNGGDDNAYTTGDVTVYTDWFPRPALELVVEMEADRIRNLEFDPALVESERSVVASERSTTVDNSQFGLLSEQLYATAFAAHPYRWPVIGWASDIQRWTVEDLKRYYGAGYAPNNCVVVVVGDVKPEEMAALARRYLEPIPRHAPPAEVRAREPEQPGERRSVVRRPAQFPLVMFGYHIPPSRDPDYWPLRVLAAVLADGRSSRLYRRLVSGRLAASVSGWPQRTLDPGLLVFSVQPRDTAGLEDAEHAFLEEAGKMARTAIPAAELEKAKNQLLAAHYRRLRTIGGRAEQLGDAEIFFGDFRMLFSTPNDIGRVTANDVQNVAKLYLADKNRTVATLLPETTGPWEASE